MVQGKCARAASDDDEKTGCPDTLLRPGIGVNENFDDRGHAEESERGKAAREPDDEQHRKKMLAESGDMRGQRGIDQRKLIFVLEQRNSTVRHMPTFDLGLTRPPKHCGRKNPRREGDQGLRDLVQKGDHGTNRAREPR